jgi:hypothetical protein
MHPVLDRLRLGHPLQAQHVPAPCSETYRPSIRWSIEHRRAALQNAAVASRSEQSRVTWIPMGRYCIEPNSLSPERSAAIRVDVPVRSAGQPNRPRRQGFHRVTVRSRTMAYNFHTRAVDAQAVSQGVCRSLGA